MREESGSTPDPGQALRPVSRRRYFPVFNALRALAALSVVVSHIEQFKFTQNIAGLFETPALQRPSAVMFFFVLSGFLITYLLLVEQDSYGRIAIGQFYLRRCLRIWPLYFLTILWAFFFLPGLHGMSNLNADLSVEYYPKLILFMVILPNVALMLFPPVLAAAHTWSVGAEEQFYLLWPLFVRAFARHLIPASLALIAIKVLVSLALRSVLDQSGTLGFDAATTRAFALPAGLLAAFPVEMMAFGAVGASLVFHDRTSRVRLLFHPVSRILCLVLGAVLVLGLLDRRFDLLLGIVFTVFVTQVAANWRSWHWLDNGLLDYLGKRSYGISMLHPSVIVLVLDRLIQARATDDPVAFNVLLYVLSVGGTIAVSALSYRWFESPFLRLKSRLVGSASGGANQHGPGERHCKRSGSTATWRDSVRAALRVSGTGG